jgi:CDP-diacylglycerol--glycerol-3-phosphate 3-phosphatidyltransferase
MKNKKIETEVKIKTAMTLPNKITMMRATLAIVMFLLMVSEKGSVMIIASLIFALAAATDWVDGYMARKTDAYTPFGAIADPFVDKILVGAAFFAFTEVSYLNVPVWAVFFIILRELAVSTLRIIAALNNHVLAAERWGKFKTVLQLSSLGLIFVIADLHIICSVQDIACPVTLSYINFALRSLPYPVTVIAATVTVLSALSYFANNWKMLRKSWSLPVLSVVKNRKRGGKK